MPRVIERHKIYQMTYENTQPKILVKSMGHKYIYGMKEKIHAKTDRGKALNLRLKKYFRTEIINFLKNPKFFYIRTIINFTNCLRYPRKILRDKSAWKENLEEIDKIAKKKNHIAFTIYGFKPGNRDLSLYQFLAITSFVYTNPNIPVYVFYAFDNDGIYWKKLNEHATLIKLSDFDFYKRARFNHYAHKSDILRLIILQNVGGIYFDIDTISVGKIEPLTHPTKAILGFERNPETREISGICNAIMWSPKGNFFVRKWLDSYKSFYSKGKDAFWGEHSIRLPLWILNDSRLKSHVIVLPPAKLFAMDWLQLNETIFSNPEQNLWNPEHSPPLIHLWETLAHEDLNRITPEFIRSSESWYAINARAIIKYLNITLKESG